ncbi:TSUP family transporter [Corynebacterium kalidii]|uniref:Probable membrane transporter protein n=1 Tax=Corynebacterium kalidii TaxID=2931982 RepID=A0A9X2B368_9CORY|nr:sulfite exporter TauE/SafE family protein [Corynebacterium kalidii]
MSATVVAVLSVTVFLAALVQGVSGIGFALIVAPVAGLLAPELLPTTLLVLMLPLNAFVAVREWRSIDIHGLTWISLARIVFTAVGLLLVATLSPAGLALLVAGVTIGAALVSLFAPPFSPSRLGFLVAGAVTGVSETATGVGGPPMALVYQHARPPVIRSTVASCFLVGEVVSLVALVVSGAAPEGWLGNSAVLLPAVILGTACSTLVVRRFPRLELRMAVIVFSIISGAVLLVQTLL